MSRLSGDWFSRAFDIKLDASEFRQRHLIRALSRKSLP